MNEFQFCYWLMGVFELGRVEQFSDVQLTLVKEHLNLVQERKYTFCGWLDGFLSAHEENDMNRVKTQKVLDKLRLEFLQHIDPSYPRELHAKLQAIHDGKPIPKEEKKKKANHDNQLPPGIEAMC